MSRSARKRKKAAWMHGGCYSGEPCNILGNVVDRVTTLVDISEYKRRQAAPGVKITERAFGKDRRRPIVNRLKP